MPRNIGFISRLRQSKSGSVALVLTLPAVLLAASEHPEAVESAARCQAIVAKESPKEAAGEQNLLTELARLRIANICASSGALVVESLRFRSGADEEMTLAAATGIYDWPTSRRN